MDAGEAEASAPGRGRQMASTKSRSSKEPPRNERTTEGATKPVSEEEGMQTTGGGKVGSRRSPARFQLDKCPRGGGEPPSLEGCGYLERPRYQESGGPS